MNEQNTQEMKLNIKGGHMYLTSDPEEIFRVEDGIVNVYVVKTHKGKLGRSLFICAVPAGTWLPTLSLENKEENSYIQLLFMAQEKAEITVFQKDSVETDFNQVQQELLARVKKLPESEERFSVRLAEYYEQVINSEQADIIRMKAEKAEIRQSKIGLILSLFQHKKAFSCQEKTGNPFYDAMSIYCEYLNIPIRSYASIESVCGSDFGVNEIARISHFIIRKVTLEEKWYHQDAGPFLAYRKETGLPVLCIPKGIDRYLLYDIENNTDFLIDKEEAATLETEGVMIYRSFPSHPLKLREVIKYGIRTVRTRDVVSFVSMTFLGVLVGLLIPFLNEKMFDELIPMGNMSAITQVGYVIFACALGNVFFVLVKNLSMLRATKSVEYAIVNATFDRLFHLPQHFLENFGSTDLVNRVLSVSTVFQMMSTGLITAVLGFLFSVFYVIKMFRQSAALTWRGLLMVLITVLMTYLFGFLCLKYERRKLESETGGNVLLYQFIAGIRKVKISGMEDRALLEFEKYNTETVKNDMKSTMLNNMSLVVSGMMSLVYAGFIYFTVIHKDINITIGEYTAFNAAFGMFSSSAMQLANFFLTMGMVIPVYKRVKPIYEQSTELSDEAGGIGQYEGKLEVNNLVFSYDEEEQPVLNDISFQINPGEYIGIVGASGCGKSTLLKLLLGFEKPDRGKIYYDNKDIDTVDKRELRKQMGVVLQDGHLTEGSIFSNIAISAPNITADEVEELMHEVGMSDDILRMPMGIFTEVSERGGTVSGGQQQRILIARAIANNPKLLLFDEATSALDNITQAEICRNLENRDMTRIVIAHRLSTVENCDRIMVMDHGKIVEQGNYTELMDRKGLFYSLVQRQQVTE